MTPVVVDACKQKYGVPREVRKRLVFSRRQRTKQDGAFRQMMRLAHGFSRDDRAVRVSDEKGFLRRLLTYKGNEAAQSGCLMFQIVDIEFSVGFSAKKCETILPGNRAPRRI